MNPASIMKIMNAKNKFTENHPKFMAFLHAVFAMTTNIKVRQSDLELLQELRELVR